MKQLLSEREINMIRGKLLAGHATLDEVSDFLFYVGKLEMLVEDASIEDFYGTEGWRHRIGWDD